MYNTNNMEASMVLQRDENNVVCGVTSIKAPLTSGNEQDIEIVLLVDVSGSMYGNPMDIMKASLEYILQRVGNRAKISVVTFSDEPMVLIELGTHDMHVVLPLVNMLQAAGGTNIHAALLCALQQFTHFADSEVVFLLTDGCANLGETSSSRIMKSCEISERCTIYPIGVGSNLDVDLLTNLASRSRGIFLQVHDMLSMVPKIGMLLEQCLHIVATSVVLHMPANIVKNLSGLEEFVGVMISGETIDFTFRVLEHAPPNLNFTLHWSDNKHVPQADVHIVSKLDVTLPLLVHTIQVNLLRVDIAHYLQKNDPVLLPDLLQRVDNCPVENVRELLKCRLLTPVQGAVNELLRQRSHDVDMPLNPFVLPLMRQGSEQASHFVDERLKRF